jgi:thioredoxin reductase (NADPH)
MEKKLLLTVLLIILSGCFQSSEKLNFDYHNVKHNKNLHTVLILGGGVAGLTAAVYLSQANIPCTVIEKEDPGSGSALSKSSSVRNWPSINNAPGSDIVASLEKQAKLNGAKIIQGHINTVDFNQWPYTIEVMDKKNNIKQLKTMATIIAMGASQRFLKVPGEKEYWGRGITNCAICDGALHRGKVVAIVGGGDTAVVDGMYLAGVAEKVHLFVRKDQFRAKDLQKLQKLREQKNVVISFNTKVREIIGNKNKITGLRITSNGEEKSIDINGFFLAIGTDPNTSIFKNQLKLNAQNFILLTKDQKTSKPGVFAAGDVCQQKYRQAVTAAADGCKAAIQTREFLEEIGFKNENLNIKIEKNPLISAIAASTTTNIITKKENQKNTAIWEGVREIVSNEELRKIVDGLAGRPFILDMFATWCGPCRTMAPVVDELAKKFAGKVVFAKINVDKADISAFISIIKGDPISGIPTFVFIKRGKEEDRIVGEMDQGQFEEKINNFLQKK